jgi:hypothetical protein
MSAFIPDGYCGLYCGSCPDYLATRAGNAEEPAESACRGCKSDLTARGLSELDLGVVRCVDPSDVDLVEPQAELPYVKMLTPPGPTRNPTMMRTVPHRYSLRTTAKIPDTTRMTARIHNSVAMIFTSSQRDSNSKST